MRFVLPAIALLALGLGAVDAQAQSCSTFLVIKSYDAEQKLAKVKYVKGSQNKYFPKPEGSTGDSKIPKKCSKRITKKNTTLTVKPTGGRMTVTQVRSNFVGKMMNDPDDPAWVPAELKKLIEAETSVVAILRPGRRNDPVALTTVYRPISDEEVADIARIDAQSEELK